MMQATNLDADDLHLHLPHCLSVCQTTTNLALAQSGPRVLSAPLKNPRPLLPFLCRIRPAGYLQVLYRTPDALCFCFCFCFQGSD